MAVVVGGVFLVEVGQFFGVFLPGLWLLRLDLVFRLAPGVLRGYAQGEASSGWFRGLGCFLRRAGPAVWRVLIAASCVLKLLRLRSLQRLASGWPVYFFSAQFVLLGVIADSEYLDSMGCNGTSTL